MKYTALPVLIASAAAARPPPHHQHPSRRRDRGSFGNTAEAAEAAFTSPGHRRTLDNSDDDSSLRDHLLSNYDKNSFPFETFWAENNQTIRSGVPIQLGLNFHRVFSVDVTTSVVDLIVWVRQQWKDPRLAWNPDDFGGRESLHAWIESGSGQAETSEIWTPDLQLWNMHSPLAETLSDAHAAISSDGTVFWSRPGHVKAVCKFQGLDDFPFDTLECTMEIGSWAYSGLYLRPVKMGDGYTVGGSNTAGEAYAEFSLLSVDCEEHAYPPYPSAPEEDWPVMFYHVSFQRAWQPYARSWMILQIVLNLASFACFWLPPHIGERMSLSITSLLAAVASELVVAANLPAAGEVTWFSKFSLMSLAFTAAALFESAVVIYFYYHTGDDLVPACYRWIQRKTRRGTTPPVTEGRKRSVRFDSAADSAASDDASANNGSTSDLDASVVNNGAMPANKLMDAKDVSESESSRYYEPTEEYRDLDVVVEQPEASESSANDSRPSLETNHVSMKEISSFRTRKSIKTILGRDADDFKNAKEMQNNVRWQKYATLVDECARVCFPVAFSVFLAWTFTGLSL